MPRSSHYRPADSRPDHRADHGTITDAHRGVEPGGPGACPGS
ncbi:hypothetical protein FM106_26000 [Brachybacterium faecium]|nr:hypothetical protein FM106_26000 [Brachybacterium faecium]